MTDTIRRDVYEELLNVIKHYPLWPGDTISPGTAGECRRLGWIRRNVEGYWIPTAAGLEAHSKGPYAKETA
jgi:hypothetical protein